MSIVDILAASLISHVVIVAMPPCHVCEWYRTGLFTGYNVPELAARAAERLCNCCDLSRLGGVRCGSDGHQRGGFEPHDFVLVITVEIVTITILRNLSFSCIQVHDHVATNSRPRHCLRPAFTSLRFVRQRDHGALAARCSFPLTT